MNIIEKIALSQSKKDFSGTAFVKSEDEILAEVSYGYANRSEQIKNQVNTRFGIASGCKLFTSIAICQLVEEGKLSFESTLKESLPITFPHFDDKVTIHHLLTHTAGIPDYFDEDVMDDFEDLWIKNPMYHIRNLKDFLPLFQNEQMKSPVGDRFHYNNAGFILLGLIVEHVSGLVFTDYVEEYIFKKAGMFDSGYFALDALPERTALGYIDHSDGTWKTNIYSIPAKGGSDGGAFVTAPDMVRLWEALMNNQLLSEDLTNQLLTAHTKVKEGSFYGYGIWIKKDDNSVIKYHIMGYDPGVSFHSAFFPHSSYKVVVCSNKSTGAFDIMSGIEEELTKVQTI
ncbi:serine hydrolase domain-containing protein [Bacillus sp. CGMCC 1.16607]|uniref:serine hydrolase domain-containing protein n=1 Tax=Bacillus sp. CGMCC 1.16607 TaxID=3351842 RepID=UPI003635ADFF